MDKNSKNTTKKSSNDSSSKPFKMKSIRKVDKTTVNSGVATGTTAKDGSKKGKKKNRKAGWKIFRICLFIFLGICIIGGGIAVGVVANIVSKTDTVALEELTLNLTSIIYDKDGNQMASIYDEENRISVTYNEIPKELVDAILSIEDERFLDHNGVDIKRTLGAIGTFILHGGKSSFGGSTITQQLVKNIKDDDEAQWTRKIREWYRAIVLEDKMSKEEIFTAYVNTIYLGDGASGIEVASQNFFGKHVKELNLAECAILAAQIQSPESTNPYRSDEAKQKLLNRQKVVLNKMLELGKINKEQYDSALNQEIAFHKSEKTNTKAKNSYFVDAVIEAVIQGLMDQKDVTYGVAQTMLYNNGYKIYTTQDPKVQSAIDEAYNDTKIFYTVKNKGFMQSSMVVMDQTNGNVLGLIGGAGEKTVDRGMNRATGFGGGRRQLGSCMKPIGAYGPAFELGLLAPGSGIDDSPLTIGNWSPHNYYNHYKGYVTVRQAIAYSMNLPAVRAYLKVGDADYCYNFAKNMGLTLNAQKDKTAASLALGGLTDGTTALEAANAYATIANGGIHIEPKFYTKVLDSKDKEVLVANSEAKRVMKDSTAYMLTSSLQSVTQPGNPNGTAYGYVKVGNIDVAGKTGNSNDDLDQWFCGFTPYYTIACWNGYDEGKISIDRPYPYASMRLFNTVMNKICSGLPTKKFEQPSSVIRASVCQVSGLVPTDACKTDPRGDRTITDYFASGTVPTKTCDIHKTVKICNETGKLATDYCPTTSEKSFITRDTIPTTKPSDWQYMVPTETCNIHTTPAKPVEPEDPGDIDIYGDKKPSNKT